MSIRPSRTPTTRSTCNNSRCTPSLEDRVQPFPQRVQPIVITVKPEDPDEDIVGDLTGERQLQKLDGIPGTTGELVPQDALAEDQAGAPVFPLGLVQQLERFLVPTQLAKAASQSDDRFLAVGE